MEILTSTYMYSLLKLSPCQLVQEIFFTNVDKIFLKISDLGYFLDIVIMACLQSKIILYLGLINTICIQAIYCGMLAEDHS